MEPTRKVGDGGSDEGRGGERDGKERGSKGFISSPHFPLFSLILRKSEVQAAKGEINRNVPQK